MSAPLRPWGEALAWALTGERLALPATAAAEPAEVVAALAGLGWPAPRLAELSAQRRAAEEPWPFPPEPALLRELGSAAAYLAALAECERLVGATGLTSAVLADRPLDAAERRLMADVPPHFGHAG